MKMDVQKTNTASAASLANLEKLFGTSLPESYLKFVKEHDGARPAANVFKVGKNNNAGVDEFIPIHESIRIREMVEGFPSHALPVAIASGRNFVYLDPASGMVYFWDHEIDDADIKLANSFDEFLAMLEPSGLSQIKLKPGQVKRVWSNPNFKPEF